MSDYENKPFDMENQPAEQPENSSETQQDSSSVQGSEYSYTRENIPHPSYVDAPRPSYVDASYQTQEEVQATPKTYYTPPEPANNIKKEKKKKKTGGMFWKVACICLVCALLGGVGGGALVAYRMPTQTQSSSGGGGLNIVSTEPGETSTPQAVVSGDTLTPQEIYALGCKQAVGVTTEVTYTNFMGTKTSGAVTGSGFIATTDGYVVTNYHVIADAYTGGYEVSVVMNDGKSYPAEIVGVEEQNDIAVLKIEASGLEAVTFGSSQSVSVGQSVYAIGNPLGELTYSMSDGMVSALDREITTTDSKTGLATTNNMFQITAAVNEGNSGGPVYNDKGQVIGIVTAKYANNGVEGLGFAIPIDDVTGIINQLIQNGYVSGKAYFGISVNTVESAAAQYYNMVEGAYVLAVNSGSCCEKAGMKVGDIIAALNDTEIKTKNDLTNAKKDYKAGDTVTVKVYRAGEYIELKVTLDEQLPTSGAAAGSTQQQPAVETPGGTITPVPKTER